MKSAMRSATRSTMRKKKPELLLPAKGPEELKTAVVFGADAVYIGGSAMGLRAGARNFTPEEMREGIAFAHSHGAKVYVTANIYAHNGDLTEAEAYFEELKGIGPDALLISDPGMFSLAKEICPEIPRHISTQANTTNYRSCLFWAAQGAERIVVARELTLAEIREIRSRIPEELELEAFVHGAMCVSYSGRCLLSAYFTGRDANHGECTHPCRWQYAVAEASRPGQYLPIEENERGTFLFNSRDLCMIEHIPELLEAGIDSFKIEGRMKNALYVASAARTYREAVDDYFTSPELYREKLGHYREEISKCTSREYSTGFFFGRPGAEGQIYDGASYRQEYVFLGIVEEVTGAGEAVIRQKNKFSVGDRAELMKRDGRNEEAVITAITDPEKGRVESAPHPKQLLHLELTGTPEKYDILRIRKKD